MLVTVLNLAFAGSAVVGGVLLETTGVGSIPWATLGLVLLAWLVVKVGVQAGKAGDITPPLLWSAGTARSGALYPNAGFHGQRAQDDRRCADPEAEKRDQRSGSPGGPSAAFRQALSGTGNTSCGVEGGHLYSDRNVNDDDKVPS